MSTNSKHTRCLVASVVGSLKWVGMGLFFRHENLCVGRRLETMRSMKWPWRKIERMVLESRSELWTICLPPSPIPARPSPFSPPLLFLPQRNRDPWTIPRSLREKFPLFFPPFFFDPSILYRSPAVIKSSVSERGGLVYSNNRIFSKQDSSQSGVDREFWIFKH